MSPHIRKAVSYARSVGFPNIGINSNAITPQVFSIFNPQELDKVTISLDGASAATHDKIRGVGSFDKTMESINIGLKKGFNVEVIYTVNKYNQSEIAKIIQLLDQLEVNKLSFNYVSPLGNARNHTDILISPEEWIEARQKIESTKNLKHLSLRFPLMFATPKEYQSLVEQGYQCLLPNTTKTEIRPDSKIYHCCLTAENPNIDGGHIENSRIIFDKEKEINFLKKNYSFACPARPCSLDQNLIPICVYYKKIIEPGNST